MPAYYNEIDPFAAAWLRELIRVGLIADGEVDERSIADVQPDDVRGFTQCHFFAGIGGWSYALRLAGWPDDRPVWTGSCPCQSYSIAGEGVGATDARNLWPTWFRLIRESHPSVLFGEQVEAAIGHGWLDDVSTNLEAEGYAVGACVLGAHSVGSFHLRQRLWFVGHAQRLSRDEYNSGKPRRIDADQSRSIAPTSAVGVVGDTANIGQPWRRECYGGVQARDWSEAAVWRVGGQQTQERCPLGAFWADAEWLQCLDGKAWPVEPGTFPLASGVSARMGRLRGYGNAIVPQVAAAFIGAYIDLES